VFDVNTEKQDDWAHRAGELLREAGHPAVEVINAAVPGHASFDAFGRLFAEVHTYQPDIVLLCNAWNDIKEFHKAGALIDRRKPYRHQDSPFISYRGPLDRFASEHSQLYVRLRRRFLLLVLRPGPEGIPGPEVFHSTLHEEPMRQYRLTADLFADCALRTGAVPVLITQPRLVVPENTEEDLERIRLEYVKLDHPTLCRAYAFTDSVVEQVAERDSVHLIDAAPQLTGVPEFFTDHVHLSIEGSERMARIVARGLEPVVRGLEEKDGKVASR
jgi:hypothetical protein